MKKPPEIENSIISFLSNEEEVSQCLSAIEAEFKAQKEQDTTLDHYLSTKLRHLGFTVTDVKPSLSPEDFNKALEKKEIWPDSQIGAVSHGTYPHLIQMLILGTRQADIAGLYSAIGKGDLKILKRGIERLDELLWFRLFDLETLYDDQRKSLSLFRSPYFVTAYICQHSEQYPCLAEAFLESQRLAFNSIAKIDDLTDGRHQTLFQTGTLDNPSIILTHYNYLNAEYRDPQVAINYLANIFRIRALHRDMTQTHLPLFSAHPLLSYLEFFIILRHTDSQLGEDYFLTHYEYLIEDLKRCKITTQLEKHSGHAPDLYYLKLNDAVLPFFYFDVDYKHVAINSHNVFTYTRTSTDRFSFLDDSIEAPDSFQECILREMGKIIDKLTSRVSQDKKQEINKAFREFFLEPLEHYLSPTETPGLYLQFESEKSLRADLKAKKQEEYYDRFFNLYNKKESLSFFRRHKLPSHPTSSWQEIFDHAIEKPNSRTARVLLELGLDFKEPHVREFFVETELDDTSDYSFGSSSQ